MALVPGERGTLATQQNRKRVISASVREVARALATPGRFARSSYIDPRLVTHYESEGELGRIPAQEPAGLHRSSAENRAAIAVVS